jgi:hypothetical protein
MPEAIARVTGYAGDWARVAVLARNGRADLMHEHDVSKL